MAEQKRGPGRPRKAQGISPDMADANPGLAVGDRESAAHGGKRPTRIPLGAKRQTLGIPQYVLDRLKAEDKHPHWILENDKGRLQAAYQAGYEHVVDAQGNNIYRLSGGRNQFLMALPNQYYREDKELKKQKAAASLGKEASIGENEYSPNKQSSAVSVSESENPYTQ